jgi:hypothetical protein
MNAPLTKIEQQQLTVPPIVITPAALMSIMRGQNYMDEIDWLEVTDAKTAALAVEQRKLIKAGCKQLTEMRDSLIEPALAIIRNARAMFNPGIEGFEKAGERLDEQLKVYDRKVKEQAARERQEREEAARKARQEAEQKTAAEAARAREIAEAERRNAEEAERQRQAAIAAGNVDAAAAAAAQVAEAQERSRLTMEEAARKTEEIHMEAAAAVPAVVEPQKIAGWTTRENWTSRRLPDFPAPAKGLEHTDRALLVITGVLWYGDDFNEETMKPKRPDLLLPLRLHEPTINKNAKALKGAMRIPGFEAFDDRIAAGTR